MKRTRDIISDISGDLPHDPEILELVIDFYWITVRKKLNSLDFTRIHIDKLGDLYVRMRPLKALIHKQLKKIEEMDKTQFDKYGRYQEIQEKLKKLNKLSDQINSEYQRRISISNDRKTINKR